jgi:hypothetical protein
MAAAARADEFKSMVHEALEGLSSVDLEEMKSAADTIWAENVDAEASPPPPDGGDAASVLDAPADRGRKKSERAK